MMLAGRRRTRRCSASHITRSVSLPHDFNQDEPTVENVESKPNVAVDDLNLLNTDQVIEEEEQDGSSCVDEIAILAAAESISKKNEREALQDKFRCPLCLDAATDVVESPCCGNIFCGRCVKEFFIRSPSHNCPTCRTEQVKGKFIMPDNWHHSKWIQREINEIAPKCLCGRNIYADEKEEHEAQCESFNLECFKCRGTGKTLTFDCGNNAQPSQSCSACNGKKRLDGLDWVKCFKCDGRGSYETFMKTSVECAACAGIGALKGCHTRCFKCKGNGAYTTTMGTTVDCNVCNENGYLKGLEWTMCFKCNGVGAYDAITGENLSCMTCEGNGVLEGLDWVPCFKCNGRGAYDTIDGRVINCSACAYRGAVKGTRWQICGKCNGVGAFELMDGIMMKCNYCCRSNSRRNSM